MDTTGYPQDATDNFDLAQFDDDFEKAAVEEREFEEPPDGKYQVIVDRVEMARSQASNNPMLKWQLKIIGPRCAGRMLFRNNMIVSPENVKWLKNDLFICGLELQKLSELPSRLGELLDVTLEVKKQTRGEYSNVFFQRRIQIDVPPNLAADKRDGSADMLPF